MDMETSEIYDFSKNPGTVRHLNTSFLSVTVTNTTVHFGHAVTYCKETSKMFTLLTTPIKCTVHTCSRQCKHTHLYNMDQLQQPTHTQCTLLTVYDSPKHSPTSHKLEAVLSEAVRHDDYVQ